MRCSAERRQTYIMALNLFTRLVEWIRRTYFNRPWPDRPRLLIDADVGELERWLREERRFEGTPYTYEYEGEVLNLRAPWGLDDRGRQRELHVRAREIDGPMGATLEVITHTELSRYEHKQEHIDGVGLDWSEGRVAMRGILGMPSAPWRVLGAEGGEK